MRSLSLKTQYIGGICGLILLVSLTILICLRVQSNKWLENEFHKRGASIARNLADTSVTPIITENFVALQLMVNDLKRNEEDISYIYIIDKQQRVVAHTFGQHFPRDLLKLDQTDMNVTKPLIQAVQIEQDQLDDVSIAIQQGNFGRVHIGLSEKMLKAEQREFIHHNTLLTGVILLIGSAAAWWFAAKVSRPIIALSKNVRMVAEGRLDGMVTIDSHDEIGELASAFNNMTADLKKRTEQQQQTEDELRMQATLLESEVAERQLAQEELSVKQCQLEALNDSLEDRINIALVDLRMKDRIMLAQGRQAAMGEMINNIAHQWRQPLNNLGLIVQSIEVEYDSGNLAPEMLKGEVEKVMDTIIFMSQTINDFSSFFSPDSTRRLFNISQGLTKVIAMIGANLSKQGIQLTIEQQEEGVTVEGYFNEYNQVLLNLLSNAKDALLERGVEHPVIKISIAREEGQAVVKVRDNAGGIPDNIIGQIFDPYFTTKEHGKGNGIGLYMSKTIIEEHFHGTLTASNVDGGAQFIITTPSAPI